MKVFINEEQYQLLKEGRNVVRINLMLNELGLQKFNKIPTFKNLLWPNQIASLKVGDNILDVNHNVWGNIQRVVQYDSENMRVEKVE